MRACGLTVECLNLVIYLIYFNIDAEESFSGMLNKVYVCMFVQNSEQYAFGFRAVIIRPTLCVSLT